MTAPYAARYADLYDLFYGDKPYGEEVAFLQDVFRQHGVADDGRVLELACGTGEHATRLAAAGYRVTATDGSAAMVELARAKAERRGVALETAICDMRCPPEALSAFDAAICLFDSIGYVQTDEAVAAVVRGVGERLRDGGVFIFEFWHAPAMSGGHDPVRVRRFRRGGSTVLRISETELEPSRSLAHVSYNVYDLRPDGTYDHIAERHTNRYFTVPELEAVARDNGFAPLGAYDGFRRAPVTDASWHVVAVWRKGKEHPGVG